MMINFIKNIIIYSLVIIIKTYQWFISPVLKTNCRYLPTCSEYTILCLKNHGIIKGGFFSIKRILSCHPFSKKGFDPIPKQFRKKT